jgi:hypothetical protein
MIRVSSLTLIAFLARGAIFPLYAQQEFPARLFDPALRQTVYAPLQGRGGAAGVAADARSASGENPAWGKVYAAPGEGRSTGALMAGGLAGGVAGVVVGAVAGAKLAEIDCTEGCDESGLYMALIGAAVGETLLLPLGVHLANRRQGSYFPAMMASVALSGAGIWLAYALDNTSMRESAPTVLLVTVPILQLAAAIQIERRTANR